MEDVTDPAVHRRRRLVAGALAAALALASATAGALTGAGGDRALPPSQAEAPEGPTGLLWRTHVRAKSSGA